MVPENTIASPTEELRFSQVQCLSGENIITPVTVRDIDQQLRDQSKQPLIQELRKLAPENPFIDLYVLKHFDGVCWSGQLKSRGVLQHYNGCIWLEVVSDNPQSVDTWRSQLVNDPYTFAMFSNPAGNRFNLVVRTALTDAEEHTAYLKAFKQYLRNSYGLADLTIKPQRQPSDVCYLGIDLSPYFAASARVFALTSHSVVGDEIPPQLTTEALNSMPVIQSSRLLKRGNPRRAGMRPSQWWKK